jgi:hypothetical protein
MSKEYLEFRLNPVYFSLVRKISLKTKNKDQDQDYINIDLENRNATRHSLLRSFNQKGNNQGDIPLGCEIIL